MVKKMRSKRRTTTLNSHSKSKSSKMEPISSTQLMDLPDELIVMVLENIESLNHLYSCRMVSRKFNELVFRVKVKNLVTEPKESNLVLESIDELLIESPDERRLTCYNANMPLLFSTDLVAVLLCAVRNLSLSSYLVIGNTQPEHVRWNDFKKFLRELRKLEYLKIYLSMNQKRILSHDNVKALEIGFRGTSKITIDLPKLKKLRLIGTQAMAWCDCVQRMNVTHLVIDISNVLILPLFKNLEHLYFENYISTHDFIRYDIQKFVPKLQTINLRRIQKPELIQLIGWTNVQRRNNQFNIKLFVSGIPVNNLQDVKLFFAQSKDLRFNTQSIIAFFYDINGMIDQKIGINYPQLIDNFSFTSGSPTLAQFVRKVRFIDIVNVDRSVEEDGLCEFLSSCKHLSKLIIKRASICQEFYDKLPRTCSNLKALIIEEDPNVLEDFEFLLDFETLKEVTINQEIPESIIYQFAAANKKLENIHYIINSLPLQMKFQRNSLNTTIDIVFFDHTFTYKGPDPMEKIKKLITLFP